ncbi:hypothetical protein R1flu_027967 [Riccia fluitans]|uniref:Glycosyltransferase n=1 Tax=Riccia fluitans TaxID=41844 RepID=A0ABD1XKC1_9MARC
MKLSIFCGVRSAKTFQHSAQPRRFLSDRCSTASEMEFGSSLPGEQNSPDDAPLSVLNDGIKRVNGTAKEETTRSVADEKGTRGPHILMVFIPSPGHAPMFVQLLYLLRHHRNVKVTVVSGGPVLAEIVKLHERGDFNDLDMHFESLFGPPPLYTKDPKFPVQAALASAQMETEFQGVKNRLIEDKDSVGAPTSLISDHLLWWTKDTAKELGIPWYTLSTAPTWFTLYEFEIVLRRGRDLDLNDLAQKFEKVNVSGIVDGRVDDIPQRFLEFPEFYANLTHYSLRATGLLINSAFEVEGSAGSLATIIQLVDQRKKTDPGTPLEDTKVLPIGPMLQMSGFGELSKLNYEPNEALQWLDTQEPGTVLYVALVSFGDVLKDVIPQLASGLEESGVPFLWIFKGQTIEHLLPEGFRERIQGRGFIETGSTSQASILLHPATGGFLTDCSWIAMLESLCAGVPMITWPLSVEQPMNARFATDIQKVGVLVRDGPTEDYSTTVTKEDVSGAVKRLMVSEDPEVKELKRNTLELKQLLSQTAGEGGSSYVTLRNFITDLLTM